MELLLLLPDLGRISRSLKYNVNLKNINKYLTTQIRQQRVIQSPKTLQSKDELKVITVALLSMMGEAGLTGYSQDIC